MPSFRTAPAAIVAVILAVVFAAPAAAQTSPGSVHFAKAAESSFDVFTSAPTDAQKTWMRSHYARMRAYSPYFDSRLSWFSDAWAYQDLYAIYRTSSLATEHPEWILKDSAGNKLYIPFGCSNGVCPQYAADFGNPAFRSWWIQKAVATMAKGYRGLFADDVNLDWRVGSGTGAFVAPRDPRTGTTMTLANWRRYMAEFTEQMRAALPGKEIVHNAIWFAGCGSAADSCWSDPQIRRELLAADYVDLERGLNDAGITGGGGRWGYESFMARIDWLHGQGKAVVFDSQATAAAGREYGLANYLLVSTGRDLLGNDPGGTPADWWEGYDVQLGAPKSGRYDWNGLVRRDFDHGYVLVNKPGGTRRTVELPAGSTGPGGGARAAVALAAEPTEKPARRARAHAKRRLSRAVLVRGRVRRASAGRVRIRLQRKVANRWVQVRRTRVAVRNGRFRKLFRGLSAGRYRVRAAYLGSSTATVSTSHARRFHI